MFCRDLSDFIISLEKENIQIILCIYLNEEFTRNNGPLYQNLTNKNNLVNILCHTHPHLPPSATNNRGSRPIDTIMVSQKLKNNLKTGWLPFGSGIGDHRISFVDILSDKFIGK